MSAVMEQGIKWRGFAKIDKWEKYIDVKVVGQNIEIDESEVSGVMKPIPLRFIDQVTASGFVSTRFELPRDEPSLIYSNNQQNLFRQSGHFLNEN